MGLVRITKNRSVMYKKKTYTKDSPPFKVDPQTEDHLIGKGLVEVVEEVVNIPSFTITPEVEAIALPPEPEPVPEPEEMEGGGTFHRLTGDGYESVPIAEETLAKVEPPKKAKPKAKPKPKPKPKPKAKTKSKTKKKTLKKRK